MPTIDEIKVILQKLTNRPKITYTEIGEKLGTGRANISLRAKNNSEVTLEEIKKLEGGFGVSIINKVNNLSTQADKFLKVPVRGNVNASMGYGISVYDETQTGVYEISSQLAHDIGVSHGNVDMIFASGNSMIPTIEGGDSLLVDLTKKEIYDGRIYCVRIDGQLYAKRLQKIPPNKVVVISDNQQYKSFDIDFSKNVEFDFEVIGEVRWWGRVAR